MLTKNKALLPIFIGLFITVQTALGVLLQVYVGQVSNAFAFGSIVLCCFFFLLFFEHTNAYALTQAALLCTVFADYFLVWRQPQLKLPAMIFFLAVQIFYFIRIYLDGQRGRLHIAFRLALSLAALVVTALVLKEKTDALAIISMLYYANLILNVIFAFANIRKNIFMAIGLLLFLLCDTVVGLNMIDLYLAIPSDSLLYAIIRPNFNLAWVFYLPSQVILSLSLLPDARASKQKAAPKKVLSHV